MMQPQYNARVYRPRQTAKQRVSGLVFIAVLHTAILYGFLTTLGFVPLPKPPVRITGHVIVVDKILPPPPIPPLPNIPRPPIIDAPPPILDVQLEPGPTAITEPVATAQVPSVQESPHVASLDPPLPPPVVSTPARAIAATHTIPDYPPVSRRLGEQGTLRLLVSITADGTVNNSRVESSSGHPRLDEAAIDWVKAHWRYEPAREGAKAVPSTAVAVVTFKLQ